MSTALDTTPETGTALTAAPSRSVGLLRPIAPVGEIIAAQEEMRSFITKALTEGRDYGVVPGTDRGGDDKRPKKSLYKPGAERVCAGFGVRPEFEIMEQEVDHDREVSWLKRKKKWRNRQFTGWEEERGVSYGLYRYVVRCVLIHIESGSTVGSGVGSASTMEGKYVDRPRESENTVLKMAKKRAFVDCTLSTFGLSDAFTQDLEDHASEADVEEGDAEVMASPAAIQAIRTEAVAGGATTGWLAWFDENTTGGATERWLGKAAADMREKLEQRRQRGRAGDLNERVRQAAAQPPHADLDRAGVTRDTPPPPDDEDDERASLAGSFDRFVLLIGDTKADARKPAADDAQRDRLLAIRIRVLVPRDAIASARLGELAHDPKLSGSQAKGLVNAGALAAAELGIALDAEPAAEDVAPPPAPGGLF